MRLPVPAVLTSNNFLSLPGKSASNKNKEEKKKEKNSQFEQILLLQYDESKQYYVRSR